MTKPDNDAEWRALGYPRGMGSAKFGVPPPDPTLVRAYHLTSAEHGISNIALRRLKIARFSEVNDPFELKALNSHKSEIRKLLAGFMDSQDRDFGLLCFSANWTNPLLWSHYATEHKGICLGFDLRRSEVECVVYKRKRPRMPATTDQPSITADLNRLLLRTKFIGWKYEQECRRFVDLSKAKQEGKNRFISFDEGLCLKEVILGERSNLSLEDIGVLTRATNPEAVVFRTRLERRGFRIVGDGRFPPQIPTLAA